MHTRVFVHLVFFIFTATTDPPVDVAWNYEPRFVHLGALNNFPWTPARRLNVGPIHYVCSLQRIFRATNRNAHGGFNR